MPEFVAVFDFGSGVKGRMSFRSPVARREVMEAALEGRYVEGNWEVTASDGQRRKLRTAIAAYEVNPVVTR